MTRTTTNNSHGNATTAIAAIAKTTIPTSTTATAAISKSSTVWTVNFMNRKAISNHFIRAKAKSSALPTTRDRRPQLYKKMEGMGAVLCVIVIGDWGWGVRIIDLITSVATSLHLIPLLVR